jgi:hypothetical protein
MMFAQNTFLEWLNAGGTVALPFVLIHGLRYLAERFQEAQKQNSDAHAQTVDLLTGVVKEATLTMRDVRHSLDVVNRSMEICHELHDHRKIALSQSRAGASYLETRSQNPGPPPQPLK